MRELEVEEFEIVAGGFRFEEEPDSPDEDDEDEERRMRTETVWPTQWSSTMTSIATASGGSIFKEYVSKNGVAHGVGTHEYDEEGDLISGSYEVYENVDPSKGIAVLGASVGVDPKSVPGSFSFFVGVEVNDDADTWIQVTGEGSISLTDLSKVFDFPLDANLEFLIFGPDGPGFDLSTDVQLSAGVQMAGANFGVGASGLGNIDGASVGASVGFNQFEFGIEGSVQINVSDLAEAVGSTLQEVMSNLGAAIYAQANDLTLEQVLDGITADAANAISDFDDGDDTNGGAVDDMMNQLFNLPHPNPPENEPIKHNEPTPTFQPLGPDYLTET